MSPESKAKLSGLVLHDLPLMPIHGCAVLGYKKG